MAKIIPLHKGGKRDDPSNKRPISILPFFSKIYEKVIGFRLTDYIENNTILINTQFGFRKKLSTEMATIKLVDWVNTSFEAGLIPAALFLDLKKAFDTIDHKQLLLELEKIGVTGKSLSWFESYLSDRKQVVVNGCFTSEASTITCGVPQGSILGPL